jgi:hypothetical protein
MNKYNKILKFKTKKFNKEIYLKKLNLKIINKILNILKIKIFI